MKPLIDRLQKEFCAPVPPREFLFNTLIVLSLVNLVFFLAGLELVPPGPGRVMLQAAESVWMTGSLEHPYFSEMYRFLQEESLGNLNGLWQDIFAVTVGGTLVPAHCVVCSVVISPVVGVAGDFGAWILNQIAAVVLFLSIYKVVQDLLGRVPSKVILLALAGSSTPLFCFSPSYDLWAASLVLAGVACLDRLGLLAGICLGAAAMIRPTNLAFLPAMVFVPGQRRVSLSALVSLLLCIIAALWLNNYLYGSPLLTSRQRMPIFIDGEASFDHPFEFFSYKTLYADWGRKLFDARMGLLLYAPMLVVVPVTFYHATKHLQLIALVWCACFSLAAVAVFGYFGWVYSAYGNRYLLPGVSLLMIPVLVWLDKRLAGQSC